jgi:hypothetical protein
MRDHVIPPGVNAAPYLSGGLRILPERLSYCSPSAGMIESAILRLMQTDFSLQQCPCFSLQICNPLITHIFLGSNSARWAAARPTLLFCHFGGLTWCRTLQHHASPPSTAYRLPALPLFMRSSSLCSVEVIDGRKRERLKRRKCLLV